MLDVDCLHLTLRMCILKLPFFKKVFELMAAGSCV